MDKKVLITDGRTLSALAVARSLGEAGHSVHCGESFRSNLTRFSKHVDRSITYPSPDEEPERVLASLLQVLRRTDYDLVIPTRRHGCSQSTEIGSAARGGLSRRLRAD